MLKAEHKLMTTFPMHDDSSRQSVSSVQDALEKILNSTRGILPGSYLLEATAYFRAFNTGDANFYWTKSEDGGLTCPSFGDGTKSILSYDQVLQELETYSQRLVSGENQINMIFTTSWLRRPLERFRVLPSGLLCRARGHRKLIIQNCAVLYTCCRAVSYQGP